ncbi:hypothetical protein [Arthrobacter pigmenti]
MHSDDKQEPEPPAGKEPAEQNTTGDGESIQGGYGGPGPENERISTDKQPHGDDDKEEEPPD